jgi:hypothetical protein
MPRSGNGSLVSFSNSTLWMSTESVVAGPRTSNSSSSYRSRARQFTSKLLYALHGKFKTCKYEE